MRTNNPDAGGDITNTQYDGAHWVYISETGSAETAPKATHLAPRIIAY